MIDITTEPSPVLYEPRFVIATPLKVPEFSDCPVEVATLDATVVMNDPPPPPEWFETVERAPAPPE